MKERLTALLCVGLVGALALIFLPACAQTMAARKFDLEATHAALNAFFEMEGVQVPAEQALQRQSTASPPSREQEAELIGRLAKLRARGADLNAFRHAGTMLQFAIVSGFDETTRWLLQNGADPTVRTNIGRPPFNPDAVGLAVVTGHLELLPALREHPKFRSLPAEQWASAVWANALGYPVTMSDLLEIGLAPPSVAADAKLARQLVDSGLCTGSPEFALAVIEATKVKGSTALANGRAPCASSHEPPPLGDVAVWRSVEARLGAPVSAFLLLRIDTPAAAQRFLQSGLLSPWSEPSYADLYIVSALDRPGETAAVLLRAVPSASLRQSLQSSSVAAAWLSKIVDWPIEDLRWALAQVDPAMLLSDGAVFQRWARAWCCSETTRQGAIDKEGRLTRWSLLTERLPAPPTSISPHVVPPRFWRRWFRFDSPLELEALAGWISSASASELAEAWPAIVTLNPELARRIPTWLVASISVGPTDDAIAQRFSYAANYGLAPEFREKARFLAAKGLTVPNPRWLAVEFDIDPLDPGVAYALEQGWVRRPPAELRSQIQVASTDCDPKVTPALRKSLALGHFRGTQGAPVRIDTVKPVQVPYQARCGWLVVGGAFDGPSFTYDETFDEGKVRFAGGCNGNTRQGAIWDDGADTWLTLDVIPEGELVPIRAANTPGIAYLFTEVERGAHCGTLAGGVYDLGTDSRGRWVFKEIGHDHPIASALALQCGSTGSLARCFGKDRDATLDAARPQVAEFADSLWPAAKLEFLSALDRLDRATLNRLAIEGVFAHWLDAGLQRVGASPGLSLSEKRRRAAWLMAQRNPRPAYTLETVWALVDWLPAEDWGPVWRDRPCDEIYYDLKWTLEKAEKANREDLRRRLTRALTQVCSDRFGQD